MLCKNTKDVRGNENIEVEAVEAGSASEIDDNDDDNEEEDVLDLGSRTQESLAKVHIEVSTVGTEPVPLRQRICARSLSRFWHTHVKVRRPVWRLPSDLLITSAQHAHICKYTTGAHQS